MDGLDVDQIRSLESRILRDKSAHLSADLGVRGAVARAAPVERGAARQSRQADP
jgi:hypothetical protein